MSGLRPTRVDQTQVGEEGNCFAACLASVTGTEVERWPDYRALAEAGSDWWQETLEILREMGWEAMMWQTTHLPDERRASIYPQGFAIVGGNSPRESREDGGFGHAVVWKDGELWHDPHPTDRTGLVGPPTEFYILLPPRAATPAPPEDET